MTRSSTDEFYEENSEKYFSRTVGVDIAHLYSNFLPLVPQGGRILDAGAGSGRDLLEFSKQGFKVMGMDSSRSLAKLAENYSGEKVVVARFEDMEFKKIFDGIWACASLLHCERTLLPRILKNFQNALVTNGVLFASVREGEGSILADDGRIYNFYTLQDFSTLIEKAGFAIQSTWKTKDAIIGRSELTWINIVARKPPV